MSRLMMNVSSCRREPDRIAPRRTEISTGRSSKSVLRLATGREVSHGAQRVLSLDGGASTSPDARCASFSSLACVFWISRAIAAACLANSLRFALRSALDEDDPLASRRCLASGSAAVERTRIASTADLNSGVRSIVRSLARRMNLRPSQLAEQRCAEARAYAEQARSGKGRQRQESLPRLRSAGRARASGSEGASPRARTNALRQATATSRLTKRGRLGSPDSRSASTQSRARRWRADREHNSRFATRSALPTPAPPRALCARRVCGSRAG